MIVKSKAVFWAGWAVSLAVTLYLLLDVSYDLPPGAPAIQANATLGIPARILLTVGIVGLASTLLYIFPPTALLGAILLTGFLGGAVFSHMRAGGPGMMWDAGENILIGVAAWGGLWLRDPRVRAILPWRGRLS